MGYLLAQIGAGFAILPAATIANLPTPNRIIPLTSPFSVKNRGDRSDVQKHRVPAGNAFYGVRNHFENANNRPDWV